MTIRKSRYPDYPGFRGDPCFTVESGPFWADLDVNTKFPYGGSLGVRAGAVGFCLDLNAPLGEPNRLYLNGPRRSWMIGLVTWHTSVEVTPPGWTPESGTNRTLKTVRCRPHFERGQAHDWKTGLGKDWRDDRNWKIIVSHPRRKRTDGECDSEGSGSEPQVPAQGTQDQV